ncbi:MAG: aspartate-semialdehyde dehydrogenase [Treponema sp.]|jgi:aspartate-semialdehyde dehydrogenase|nr:aspartate-semialdehyde dehydrogenase [Treponema sp.]
MKKIPVGILGATGMVGQMYVSLLSDHPWFQVRYAAASPRSAGKTYREAVAGRWRLSASASHQGRWGDGVGDLVVEDANDAGRAVDARQRGRCAFVFSALEMGKEEIQKLEEAYAASGVPVVSNASAHRWTADVPMLIAEVNPHHTEIIPAQQKARGWKSGFIAVKPNCSIQSYTTPLWALMRAGFEVKRLLVSTMQAVSGAGYPGVPGWDLIDNLVPYIGGEEEKSEGEPLKIFGEIKDGAIVNAAAPVISAHCSRVPVSDGHTACVSVEFGGHKPSVDEVTKIWRAFRALPQEAGFPLAPPEPIVVREEADRPQPRKDRDAGRGMAVTVGRIRPCPVFDLRFTGLSHNTIRGAAGGGILNAELLKHQGYLG